MTLLDELRRRLEVTNLSHRGLEIALGLEANALKGILDAKEPRTPSVRKAKQIADALGLEFYVGPRRVDMAMKKADPDDFLQVPVFDVALAAGAGAHNYGEDVIAHVAFRKGWLREIGASPEGAVIARAWGESMSPTIHDGDMVLIDRTQATAPSRPRDPRDTRPAAIYALIDTDHARIKRVDLAAPGTLALFSDNPATPPEFRPVSAVSIIGRVLWWGHTNKE